MIGFVVNPVSGNGKGIKTWKKIERALQKEKSLYLLRITEKPGDAAAFAMEMARRGDCAAIVAVGGDGTVSETAAGLLAADAPAALGHIPAGSGNDFSRAMGIPAGELNALSFALSGAAAGGARRIDFFAYRRGAGPEEPAGVSGQPGGAAGVAVCSMGAGFDGKVAQETNRSAYKRWLNRFRLGSLAYPLSVLIALATYKPCRVRVAVDGQAFDYDDVWLVAVANVSTYGGGMRICPHARPDDGLADVCVVHRLSRLQFLRFFPRVYSGSHIGLPYVSLHRGQRVEIRADRPLSVHADGEYAGETPLEIRVVAGALPVLGTSPDQCGNYPETGQTH